MVENRRQEGGKGDKRGYEREVIQDPNSNKNPCLLAPDESESEHNKSRIDWWHVLTLLAFCLHGSTSHCVLFFYIFGWGVSSQNHLIMLFTFLPPPNTFHHLVKAVLESHSCLHCAQLNNPIKPHPSPPLSNIAFSITQLLKTPTYAMKLLTRNGCQGEEKSCCGGGVGDQVEMGCILSGCLFFRDDGGGLGPT